MSRTIRRKRNTKDDLYWVTTKNIDVFESECNWLGWVRVPLKDRELAIALAEYYSDAYRNFKEPGPSWFRTMFSQRPYRRESARQIQRYLQGEDLEVIIESKPPLEYWT